MSLTFASRSTNSNANAAVWGIYQKIVGNPEVVSPIPEVGTKATSDLLP
jgi:hypothetical protein